MVRYNDNNNKQIAQGTRMSYYLQLNGLKEQVESYSFFAGCSYSAILCVMRFCCLNVKLFIKTFCSIPEIPEKS